MVAFGSVAQGSEKFTSPTSTGGWFGRRSDERERWAEFASLEGELVTGEDAAHAGLPGDWYEGFVRDHFSGGPARVEGFRFAADDASVRGLLRYKARQRQLLERFAPILEESLSAHDAIAAGAADLSLAALFRQVFPEHDEVSVRELCPEITRRAIADFFIGRDGLPSLARVRHALSRTSARRERLRLAGERAEDTIDLDFAIQSGAADDRLPRLVRERFGAGDQVTVGQLLHAVEVPEFARLLAWHRMMYGWG